MSSGFEGFDIFVDFVLFVLGFATAFRLSGYTQSTPLGRDSFDPYRNLSECELWIFHFKQPSLAVFDCLSVWGMKEGKLGSSREQLFLKMKAREEEARRDPDKYRGEVVAAAVFGYMFPFVLVIAALAVLAGVLWLVATNGGTGSFAVIKLALVVIPFCLALLGSMWVEFERPKGFEVTAADQPKLFEAIEFVRKAVSGPKIREVYISDDLNASIQQAPRFGLVGGHINRLSVGVPLMAAVDEDEFKAVLAHEYGHLIGAHGKTLSWIYRTRILWAQLQENLHAHASIFNLPLRFFYDRFEPHFREISFPLARSDEYYADAVAAKVTNPEIAGRALRKVALAAHYLNNEFWPSMNKRAFNVPEPDIQPHRHFASQFLSLNEAENIGAWEKLILTEETGYADTHPALKDRLAALNVESGGFPPFETSFLASLGAHGEELICDFDKAWLVRNREAWAEQFSAAKGERQRLEALSARAAQERLDLSDVQAWLDASLSLESNADAQLKFETALLWYPNEAAFLFNLGRLKLERKDANGLELVEKAATLRADLRYYALDLQYLYHAERGDAKLALQLANQRDDEAERQQAAREEMAALTFEDKLTPPTVSPEELARIRAFILNDEDIKAAYLVRKASTIFENWESHHLVIKPKNENNYDYDGMIELFVSTPLKENLYIRFATSHVNWMHGLCKSVSGSDILSPQ